MCGNVSSETTRRLFYNIFSTKYINFTGTFPVGDTSCSTLIAVCVRACVRAYVRACADISLNCAKND